MTSRRATLSACLAAALLAVAGAPASQGAAAQAGRPPFAVGLSTLRFADPTRSIRLPNGRRVARTFVTYVRYPTAGRASSGDLPGAPLAPGRYPLVVFAHGYALTPGPYAALLRAWARAGYVVAAPVFPLENANAPGGPDESDIVNEPRDMQFLISQLLAMSATPRGALSGSIDPAAIAVAGHSDGGETALAAAYDRRGHDRRVRAALILSGAEIPGFNGFARGPGTPPLLAVQGTSDTTNYPGTTYGYFAQAPHPRYLLRLLGAGHLPPYTDDGPYLRTVEHVTTLFLNKYLKGGKVSGQRLATAGNVHGTSALVSQP